MPDRCVAKYQCGTHAPGWLTGGHPTVAHGAVSRKVCFHWSRSCCQWSRYIRVRNCGAFYVYYLGPTPVCNLRYCGAGTVVKPYIVFIFVVGSSYIVFCYIQNICLRRSLQLLKLLLLNSK